MSRIGKLPIEIPENVEVTLNDGNQIIVKGPLGTLTKSFRKEVNIEKDNGFIKVTRNSDTKACRALHGLTRVLIKNMVDGVIKGFTKELEMIGVGYRGQMKGDNLILSLGYSHPVEIIPQEGVSFKVENNTNITVSGYDKQAVGDAAAYIRRKRPPEVYKGKGVRYKGEYIRKKAGKAGKKG